MTRRFNHHHCSHWHQLRSPLQREQSSSHSIGGGAGLAGEIPQLWR